jgi:hypothetical protein
MCSHNPFIFLTVRYREGFEDITATTTSESGRDQEENQLLLHKKLD